MMPYRRPLLIQFCRQRAPQIWRNLFESRAKQASILRSADVVDFRRVPEKFREVVQECLYLGPV
jgi:hypothetical protein